MPNGDFPWPPERFQQHVIDWMKADEAWKQSVKVDCTNRLTRLETVEKTVLLMENDNKWWKRAIKGVVHLASAIVAGFFAGRQ